MDPEALLEAVKALTEKLADGLRADMAEHCKKLDAKYDAIADSMKKLDAKKKDEDEDADPVGEERHAARRTAADSVSRADLEVLRAQVRDLQVRQPTRTPSDRDALADLQAKADVAYRALGERADMPMMGEGTVEYAIRLHRGLQRHLPKDSKWKGVELAVAARDPSTFAAICDSVRAGAYEAGISPIGMPEFQHREIKTESPGGHRITTFVGNGTIFKQMSRPVRHVISIGANDKFPRSAGGQVFAAGQ